jgi:hypothetical protein
MLGRVLLAILGWLVVFIVYASPVWGTLIVWYITRSDGPILLVGFVAGVIVDGAVGMVHSQLYDQGFRPWQLFITEKRPVFTKPGSSPPPRGRYLD